MVGSLSWMVTTFTRPQAGLLSRHLGGPRRFLQVVAGPRQVGKSTLVRQVLEQTGLPSVQVSADEPTLRDRVWIEQQWDAARLLTKAGGRRGAILALDEVQKVPGWSETVKRLWDEDSARRLPLKVVLLGSAPLLVQRGLSESLAGRFEILRLPHWSFGEMRDAFGWSLERYLFFGGYPGAAPLARDPRRWARYVKDALIETTISRDVLLLTRVDRELASPEASADANHDNTRDGSTGFDADGSADSGGSADTGSGASSDS